MYAVIFTAELKEPDESYYATANRMRDLAINKYGCLEFTSVTEGSKEIAISYWNNEQQIKAWKQDLEHLEAQKNGKTKWYKTYKVQIVKILREYTKGF